MGAMREDIVDEEVRWKYEQEGWTLKEIANYYSAAYSTIYNRLFPERMKGYYKKYFHSDKGKVSDKESGKRYRQTEKGKAAVKRHQQSDKGKVSVGRHSSKRRQLGFISLNTFFDGGVWHHIDEEHVICIPEELHISIPHNVWTGQGMEAINEIAFQYIAEETFDKLIGGEI